jgi:hypothetical protein
LSFIGKADGIAAVSPGFNRECARAERREIYDKHLNEHGGEVIKDRADW